MPESIPAGVELHPPLGPYLEDLLIASKGNRRVEISKPSEWRLKRKEIRSRLLETLGEFPTRRVPLEAEVVQETKRKGEAILFQKIVYSVEKEERVPAYLLRPTRLPRPAPAVLCLHQTTPFGKEEPTGFCGDENLAYALHLARRGFVTLTPDHITTGERRDPTLNAFDTSAFYEKYPQWSAIGKAVWDNRCAVDYLCSLDFVDAEHLGCIGHSLGGHQTAFTAAFDERIAASVSNCGLTIMAEDPNRLNWARDHWYIYIPRLRPYLLAGRPTPFDFHEVVALIAPRAFLNISALNDDCFPRNNALAEMGVRVSKVYRLLRRESSFANYLHGNRHSFPHEARELAFAWLERWLKV